MFFLSIWFTKFILEKFDCVPKQTQLTSLDQYNTNREFIAFFNLQILDSPLSDVEKWFNKLETVPYPRIKVENVTIKNAIFG